MFGAQITKTNEPKLFLNSKIITDVYSVFYSCHILIVIETRQKIAL